MGYHCYSDIVPYVAHAVYFHDGNSDDDLCSVLEPEEMFHGWLDKEKDLIKICEEIGDEYDESTFEYDEIENNGWVCENKNHNYGYSSAISKSKRVGGIMYKKGKKQVWLINEAEYANAGVMELSVAAKDRESIKEFCRDWGFPCLVINKNDTVMECG